MARTKDPELEARRRRELLDVTIALLGEEAFHAVTQDKVASAAGVSKGVVTYYFPTKADLLVAAIERYHEQVREGLEAIVALPGLRAREKLRLLVHAAFPSSQAVEREVRFQSEVWSLAKDHPAARDATIASYRAFRDACGQLLRLGAEEGLPTAGSSEWTYLFIHALIDGLSFQLAVQPELDLPALRERLERVILALAAGVADAELG
ncbi:MAG: TetR/AcrR family transcriptional regulator [Polyangiales bacterium]|nr:TetR/AcrR family transcriptional regulator [Myxococcales bacterium]MCB9659965.1 TetR/AcrR family transcriptional regulator [Sandaracinaceae bacterium]